VAPPSRRGRIYVSSSTGSEPKPSDREPIAARLGRYIARARAGAFSPSVREKAGTCLLDGLALGMAAGEEATSRAVLASPFLRVSLRHLGQPRGSALYR
jgi:hypothetical protein